MHHRRTFFALSAVALVAAVAAPRSAHAQATPMGQQAPAKPDKREIAPAPPPAGGDQKPAKPAQPSSDQPIPPAQGAAAAAAPATPGLEKPYKSAMRQQCETEMAKDKGWWAVLKDRLRYEVRSDDAASITTNRKHVVYAYAAIWALTAVFLALMFVRQSGLKQQIAELELDLSRAEAEDDDGDAGLEVKPHGSGKSAAADADDDDEE